MYDRILTRNNKFFRDLVKGEYGRRVLYTDVEEITEVNILQVISKCVGDFYWNRMVINYLWHYYKGDQPILYRTKVSRDDIINKVVENHAYEFVQFKTGQTYGEPIQCVSRKDDETINQSVDDLNDYLQDADKHTKDIKSGEWQSATGTSFKAAQIVKDADIPFRIVSPSPLNTYIIYSRITEEPMLAVQELRDENGKSYSRCFTSTHQCDIKGGKVLDWALHAYGNIPIVEYPNNHERLSDIELAVDILDAINNMQSNRMDGVEQFVQSWVKFVNCSIDEETFQKMKTNGALVVKSNNGENKADVDIMTQELNQTESQVAKQDLLDNALTILAIPNKQGNTGGDSQGAVELRNGWDFSKTRAKLKDPLVKSSEKRLISVVLNILRIYKEDLKLTLRDFDVQINHSPTDNMVVKCQSLQYLLECGIHPLVAIRTVGLWGDAEKVFLLSKPYLDTKYQTIEEQQEQQARQLLEDFQKQTGGIGDEGDL